MRGQETEPVSDSTQVESLDCRRTAASQSIGKLLVSGTQQVSCARAWSVSQRVTPGQGGCANFRESSFLAPSSLRHRYPKISKDIISLEAPVERAILVGAPLKRTNARHLVDEHLRELERLADTAGATVVGELTQQLDRPNPSTYVGSGKVEELKQMIADKDATVLIFDDELTPAQGKNLEEELGKRVIDRAELILDIFAVRARSAEARMQVELAQLEYSLPRLTRMWTHLEKFRGGIGVRGPGETQLESDRRLVGQRIKLLKDRLLDVQRSREIQRQGRKSAFRASLVGYTNAGKSSILKAMSGAADIFVEDRLFATLDPLTRDVQLGENQKVLLTDTVGFIRKLPHHLVASFRATLEEVGEADLLLHVIDASHPTWEEQRIVVDEVLADLGVHDTPVLHVFNKMDRLSAEDSSALRERMANLLPNSVFVSAQGGVGLGELREALLTGMRKQRPIVRLRVPAANGKLLAEIHREGDVLESASDPETGDTVLSARVDGLLRERLERAGVVA
jgi:GTP-binding protein HflX